MTGVNGFTNALRQVSTEYMEISTGHPQLNNEIINITNHYNPDLIFIQIQSEGLSVSTLDYLKNNKAFVINWSGDVREPLPSFYIDIAKYVDISCFSNMNDVETIRNLGYKSEYLDIGFDPEIYRPDGVKANSPDIVFMGNNCGGFPLSTFRQEMVKFLQDNYRTRFGIYGSGWHPCNGNYMGDQLGESSVYRGAKFAINLSHFNYKNYSSDRLYRAMGSGVMVLSHNYENIDDNFTHNTHLAKWYGLPGLKQLIDYYTQKEDLRRSIAFTGYKLAIERHTFLEMCNNIIKIYKQHA